MDTLQPSSPVKLDKPQVDHQDNPFKSFWMGGYECCDMLNRYGRRTDLLAATRHIERIDEDYDNLKPFGIKTVREGIVWSRVEYKPYHYDWQMVDKLMAAGQRHGIQQVWDMCHFGMPNDISPLHPQFCGRFVALCAAFASRYHRRLAEMPLIITPINEVSFLSWLGGEVGATTPYSRRNGWDVKYNLCKAYIESINAIRSIDKNIRILTTEPLVNIVPPKEADPDTKEAAFAAHEEQFQVTDILFGSICPELGGSPRHLDIVGYNYYFSNQFSTVPGDMISWTNEHNDERYVPLHRLLIAGYYRYEKPILLSETSHPLDHRPYWLGHISEECIQVIDQHIPLWGICWYPLLNRPDWDHTEDWHHSGLWEVDAVTGDRKINVPLAEALNKAIYSTAQCSK